MKEQYICLYNPHSEEYLVFRYDEQKQPYAPNYGCPISNGKTPEEAIDMASMFNINPKNVING